MNTPVNPYFTIYIKEGCTSQGRLHYIDMLAYDEEKDHKVFINDKNNEQPWKIARYFFLLY